MCPAISKKEQLFMADRFSSALLSPVNQEPVALESDAQREKEKKKWEREENQVDVICIYTRAGGSRQTLTLYKVERRPSCRLLLLFVRKVPD